MAIGEAAALNLAAKLVEKASPAILQKISAKISDSVERTQVKFTKTFQRHIAWGIQRSKFVKTIVSKDKPVELEKIYVKLKLSCEDSHGILDDDINPTSDFGLRYIISGTGGAGKTILMKHLFNLSVDNILGLVPLFIELRSLDFSENEQLDAIIMAELHKDGANETLSLFRAGLAEGIFAIFLDGFDEINPEYAEKALDLISRFSRQYPQISIVASTRLATGLQNLQDFTTYHLSPLDKAQAIELVEKTSFDKDSKSKFLKALKGNLYDKHPSMLSLPILLVMMLLTFRTYADIPDRMTVFYGQAFETLYSIHDSENKNRYRRIHHSKLPPDLFKKVIQAFCYISLSKHELEFTSETLSRNISDALKITNMDVKTESFENDIVKNVCIIQPDGISYVFVHRSFQEYFAAGFALNFFGEKHFNIIDRIALAPGSNVASMMFEMNSALFEKMWILPKLKWMLAKLKSMEDEPLYKKANIIFESLTFVNGKFSATIYGDVDNLFWVASIFGTLYRKELNIVFLLNNLNLDTQDIIENDGYIRLKSAVMLEKAASTKYSKKDNLLKRDRIELNEHTEELLKRSNLKDLWEVYVKDVEDALSAVQDRVEKQISVTEELLMP